MILDYSVHSKGLYIIILYILEYSNRVISINVLP